MDREKKLQRVVLTNTVVSQLKPKAKTYDIRDQDLKGFLVRVYPSGTKSYRCEYKRGKHITLGRTIVLSATQARNRAKQLLGEVAGGIDPKAEALKKIAEQRKLEKKLTLQEFLDKEYAPWFKTNHPRTYLDTLKDIKRNFLPDFGDKSLEEITRPMIERWRIKRADQERVHLEQGKRIRKKIRPSSINRNIEKFSALLNRAVEFEYLEQNPIKGMKKLQVPHPERIRYLSKEEYQRLMKALDEREEELRKAREQGNIWRKARGYDVYPLRQQTFADHLKPMVLLALGSGIRRGALMRLQWQRHVDFSQDNITIKLTADIVKTAQGRHVPLDDNTSHMLRQWYKQLYSQQQGQGWVFPGKNIETHITSVKRSWQAVLKRAAIDNFTWHDMRHDLCLSARNVWYRFKYCS